MTSNTFKSICLVLLLSASCSGHVSAPESGHWTVESGQTVSLSECHVRALSDFKAEVDFDGEFQGITLRRGALYDYWGAALEITPDSVRVREYSWYEKTGKTELILRESFAHHLKLKSPVNVEIRVPGHNKEAILTISSEGAYLERKIFWRGGGTPMLINDGTAPVGASLSFERNASGRRVWFLADSYFSEYDEDRWPYYMMKDGYTEGWMADHQPGGGSAQFLRCFKNDLRFGKPETAVWMLGMNDPDSPEGIDRSYLESTEEFISICDSLGIEPVLVTVPSVPERCHDFKTAWVRASGRRYIDWFKAVGAKAWDGSEEDLQSVRSTGKHRPWAKDYLYEDDVHPTESGAKVLWEAVKEGLDELKERD